MTRPFEPRHAAAVQGAPGASHVSRRAGVRWAALAVAVCAAAAGCSSDETVSADAALLVEKVAAAYQSLESASFEGTIRRAVRRGDGGDSQNSKHEFTSIFRSPNQFRHDEHDVVLLGSSGAGIYVYDRAANAYGLGESADGKVTLDSLPDPFAALLREQNPAILLALAPEPAEVLRKGATRIRRGEDMTIDGESYAVLTRASADGERLSIAVDPETGFIRRYALDAAPDESSSTSTRVVVDYSRIDTQADLTDEQFAWTPPEGARNLTAEPGEELIGEPAPEFTLVALDGRTVSLGDLKGRVVVLDFWAKWCGPCIKTLPHFAELRRDLADSGTAFFAVNLGDSREDVAAFTRTTELDVPVLLDSEAETQGPYEAYNIPHTVVIGRDGLVKRVFQGLPPWRYNELRSAVEAAIRD